MVDCVLEGLGVFAFEFDGSYGEAVDEEHEVDAGGFVCWVVADFFDDAQDVLVVEGCEFGVAVVLGWVGE